MVIVRDKDWKEQGLTLAKKKTNNLCICGSFIWTMHHRHTSMWLYKPLEYCGWRTFG